MQSFEREVGAVRRLKVLLMTGVFLSGCASMPEFSAPLPAKKLVLEQALSGRTLGDGVFVNSITGGETKFSVVIMSSEKIQKLGFKFRHTDLSIALRELLKK